MQNRHKEWVRALHGDAVGALNGAHWNAEFQAGSCTRGGPDLKCAANRLEPFAHADEAKAFPPRAFNIKSDSVVSNREFEATRLGHCLDGGACGSVNHRTIT